MPRFLGGCLLLFKAPSERHVLMPAQASISVGDAEIFCCVQRDQWKSFALRDAKSPFSQFFFSWLQVIFFSKHNKKSAMVFFFDS